MSGPQYLEDGFGVDLTAIARRSFETVLFSYGPGVWGFRFRGLGPSGFSGFGLIGFRVGLELLRSRSPGFWGVGFMASG